MKASWCHRLSRAEKEQARMQSWEQRTAPAFTVDSAWMQAFCELLAQHDWGADVMDSLSKGGIDPAWKPRVPPPAEEEMLEPAPVPEPNPAHVRWTDFFRSPGMLAPARPGLS